MKIILADSAGFCFGVKRATNLAFEAAEQYPHICSLGPIIHSPQVVKKLEEKGVKSHSRGRGYRPWCRHYSFPWHNG